MVIGKRDAVLFDEGQRGLRTLNLHLRRRIHGVGVTCQQLRHQRHANRICPGNVNLRRERKTVIARAGDLCRGHAHLAQIGAHGVVALREADKLPHDIHAAIGCAQGDLVCHAKTWQQACPKQAQGT